MKKMLIIAAYFLVFWILLPALLILCARGIDMLLFPGALLPHSANTLGWVLLCPSALGFLSSIYQFRKFSGAMPVSALPPDRLIEKGWFVVWRHPIYLFAVFTILGLALILRSRGFVFVVFPLFVLTVYLYIRTEEHFLIKRFGKKYLSYRKRVPLLIPRFFELLRIPAVPFFRLWFRLRVHGRENIPDSPPYFIVAAHRNYFDPFFVSYAIPHMIRHICTFEMFRSAAKARLFRWMGAIPKKRYKSDYQSNKEIIRALNEGYVIGVFPECERSWTGATQSLKQETLVMLRHHHTIPILPMVLAGNYHAWPRWSNHLLKARVHVHIGVPFHLDPEMALQDAEALIMSQIHARPTLEADAVCRSKNRIGKLSVVLYRCPACQTFETLQEVPPKTLVCTNCHQSFVLHPGLQLSTADGGTDQTVSIDGLYQKIRIREKDLKNLQETNHPAFGHNGFDPDEHLIYHAPGEYYEEQKNRLVLKEKGEILVSDRRIYLVNERVRPLLEIRDADAVNIESNRNLQIYQARNDRLIQLGILSSSVLLWQDLLVLILDKIHHKIVTTR